jgi:hypothetical protein
MSLTETIAEAEVSAEINFVADRNPDGVWSNLTPHLRTQALRAHEVVLRDARRLASAPHLDREGFAVARHRVESADWWNENWVAETYIPACIQLVRGLTGAAHAAPVHTGVLLRDSAGKGGAPAADFVHLDNTREAVEQFLEHAVPANIRAQYHRVRVFNVWRATTPPPQDVPLALCDQRTVDEADWVIGRTVEPMCPEGVPYIASLPNPAHRWFFFSDLTPDEVVVFKGYDSDPDQPFGCLHGAFRHPAPGPVTVPRASAETRVFVLT